MIDNSFIKIYFNGKSSEDFGLWVVNDGSRYSTSLTPDFSTRTTTNPGRPGSLFWGADIKEKTFEIKFATSGMTGEQLSQMKAHFVPGKFGELSFEESIYKYYIATIQEPPIFNFIPFLDHATNQDIYKGEVDIKFLCPHPYAYSKEWLGTDYVTKSWFVESGLPLISDFPETGNTVFFIGNGRKIKNRVINELGENTLAFSVYNCGTQEAKLKVTFEKTYTISGNPPIVLWNDIIFTGGQSLKIIKPRLILDIETTLSLIYENWDDWSAQKLRVVEQLKQDLDSPARETLINIAANAGGALSSLNTVKEAVEGALINGVTYKFEFDGENNTAILTTVGSKFLGPTLTSVPINFIENISGAFYGGPFVAFATAGKKPILANSNSLLCNQTLTNLKIFFKNTYV